MQANPLCVMCEQQGRVRLWQHLDHVTAIDSGGPDIDSNRQGLCIECHKIKTAKDMGHTYRPTVKIGADGWPID
jgi:5-methylcytosine-specific restriction enzyme A